MSHTAQATKDRPILFSGPLVRAILAGRKTQTRRIVKAITVDIKKLPSCPYGGVGDLLWVRETHALISPQSTILTQAGITHRTGVDPHGLKRACVYREQEKLLGFSGPWKPSIFMFRWASRLTLRVTALRVEQLQDITEDDAEAEGVDPVADSYVTGFCHKWHEINGPESWAANPWVWVVEFERVQS